MRLPRTCVSGGVSAARARALAVATALPLLASGACGSDDASQPDAGGPSGDAAADGTFGEAGADAVADAPSVDAPPPPCSGPGPSPDAWSTYGHDARRSSASNGCIHPSMTELWRYGGNGADAAVVVPSIYNAVADTSAVYAHVSFTAPTVDKVSATDGKQSWRYKGGADYDTGNWLTIGLGFVLADDDGIYLINTTDGTLKATSGVDWWGQSAADDKRFYLVTSTHGDGPGAFVGAWEVAKGLTWKANQQGGCSPPVGDENGALAVDAGVVYFAPRYETGLPNFGVADGGTFAVPSGLYAFDAAAGTPKWSVPASPQSSISVGDGHVYLVEPGPALVARNITDGKVAWSVALAGQPYTIGSQPPLLAFGRVIVGTSDHVLAFDAATGKASWSTPVPRAALHGSDSSTINFVSCPSAGEPNASPIPTTFAAALASGTLVVTGSDAVHFLSLATGVEQGKYALAQALDPIIVGDRLYVVASSNVGTQIVALQSH